MIKLYDEGVYLVNGDAIVKESESERVEKLTGKKVNKEEDNSIFNIRIT